MKNSIFKSYAKKMLRSEAFVSVIIVFVLAIGIIGTSYALYMDVDTDTDYQVVEVGSLLVSYNNGDNTINLSNVTPTDDEVAINSSDNLFSFFLINDGTYTANYDIKLVPDTTESTDSNGNVIGPNEISPEYIRFQICKDNATNCKSVKNLSDYVTVDDSGNVIESKAIYNDEISPQKDNQASEGAYYFIRMWITSEGYGTDEYNTAIIGKRIKYKVDINVKNASGLLDNKNTLAGRLLGDDRVTINNTIPNFNIVETEEKGLYKADDDYGISYYYRGAQSYNYVNFAGFIWRVVRINGDGSIRIALDGFLDTLTDSNGNVLGKSVVFNDSTVFDNAHIGYMYGEFEGNSTSYDEAHANINDSTVKKEIDKFYQNYIISYKEYLSDNIFCGDKELAVGVLNENVNLGYSNNATRYAAYDRLYTSKSTPSLECAVNSSNNYSRYTVNESTTEKGVKTNGNLTYPIALLSADEIVMAGQIYVNSDDSINQQQNTKYYLYNAYSTVSNGSNEHTMTPESFNDISILFTDTTVNGKVDVSKFVRPVINLKADVLWASGDGTVDTPYEVKLY